jgi:hypothetical protein
MFGFFDIPVLCALVSTTQQEDQHRSTLDEIHSIARPVMNTQFADAFPNGPYVARITEGQAANRAAILALAWTSQSLCSHSENDFVSRISITGIL